jgi:hypothetical protein
MVDEKTADKIRKSLLKTATEKRKVTKSQKLALGQVEESEKAGHKMIKKNPPKIKMTSVMKSVAGWAFPGLAKQQKRKNRMISGR